MSNGVGDRARNGNADRTPNNEAGDSNTGHDARVKNMRDMRTTFFRADLLILSATLSILGLLLCPASATAEPQAPDPGEQSTAELEQELRSFAEKKLGRLMLRDDRLQQVARWLAGDHRPTKVDRGEVRDRLWRKGVVDFEFSPLRIRFRTDSEPQLAAVAALEGLLTDPALRAHRHNAMALAVERKEQTLTVGVLLLRRVVRLSGSGFLNGAEGPVHMSLSGSYRAPRLFVTKAEGEVLSFEGSATDKHGNWTLKIPDRKFPGTSLWELVADGSAGPEVLALWRRNHRRAGPTTPRRPARQAPPPTDTTSRPLARNPYLGRGGGSQTQSGTSAGPNPSQLSSEAGAWAAGAHRDPNRAPRPNDVRLAEQQLWGLIQATRKSRNLLPLRASEALSRAARQHASDLGRGERFGHHTSSGNAISRLEQQGLAALRLRENVAMAANVAEAHAALMASPAHRANLLDPEVSSGGVGVVLKRDARGRWSALVSQLFAELLADGPGEQWQEAILNRINGRRRAMGLATIKSREKLDELALRTSEEILRSGSLRLSASQRREIAQDARFHYLNVRRVGVDLIITSDPSKVDKVTHVTHEEFMELGIGIRRLRQPMGEHSAGSLVITLVFIER